MSLLIDYVFRLWGGVGLRVIKVLAPSRAVELEKHWADFVEALPPESATAVNALLGTLLAALAPLTQWQPPEAHAAAEPQQCPEDTGQGDNAPCCASTGKAEQRRITCDLEGDQQDQDPANTPGGGALEENTGALPPSEQACSLTAGFHDLISSKEFKSSSPSTQLSNLLNLLLQADEDNAVLKSALETTLDKLQATREELQATKAELQATQEQAELLLDERDAVCFQGTAADAAFGDEEAANCLEGD